MRLTEFFAPFALQVELLSTIPGVDKRTAETLIAEIGADMSRFGCSARLASWAGMCPGQYESAGKSRRGTTRHGSKWLRTALVESARAASRTKITYLAAQYNRLHGRRGHGNATVAVGHSILVASYYILERNVAYADLGGDWFLRRDTQERHVKKLVSQLKALGYEVTIEHAA
jgi:transposase